MKIYPKGYLFTSAKKLKIVRVWLQLQSRCDGSPFDITDLALNLPTCLATIVWPSHCIAQLQNPLKKCNIYLGSQSPCKLCAAMTTHLSILELVRLRLAWDVYTSGITPLPADRTHPQCLCTELFAQGQGYGWIRSVVPQLSVYQLHWAGLHIH